MPRKKSRSKKTAKKAAPKKNAQKPARSSTERYSDTSMDELHPDQSPADDVLKKSLLSKSAKGKGKLKNTDVENRLREHNIRRKIPIGQLVAAVNKINPDATLPVSKMPDDIKKSLKALQPATRRFHGIKVNLGYFPFPMIKSRCADKFGYLSSAAVRNASKLPFDQTMQDLLGLLGDMMGDPDRETAPDSTIPAGFTYFGQFVDHDVTFDVSSTLDTETDANTLNNMRSPALDLDSVYGRGPALDPFLYVFPTSGPQTAIKFQLGTNMNLGVGGPGGSGGFGGMVVQIDFDVPRMHNPLIPVASSNTAIIGDPRNDENLIVSQFHQTMLKFHNEVVNLLTVANFNGDIFIEAKKIVTHHYQWAVIHDFLTRVCGATAVNDALTNVNVAVNSAFRMPVEFAVAAYRFGHSMIRSFYWLNFIQINATLGNVFAFNRNPNIPVLSNWVVDFNAFFDTGVSVPVNNKARKIDSVLANGLESLPGGSGIMAVLATRNLRRGLALGLPSGQALATSLGITPLTTAQLTQDLPPNEVGVLNLSGGVLLQKTPLWYYVLREAAVLGNGNQLGPLGGRIVAETFVRMLKRDATSYLNVPGGFTPMLPSVTPGDFTVADLVIFAGVTQP
jgi:hypothetical protein